MESDRAPTSADAVIAFIMSAEQRATGQREGLVAADFNERSGRTDPTKAKEVLARLCICVDAPFLPFCLKEHLPLLSIKERHLRAVLKVG